MNSNVFNIDCMEGMKNTPDKFYELAIVDPPYGISAEQGTNRKSRLQFSEKKFGWDSCAPDKNYFNELFRVSKNQVIWGANHFIENIPNANSKHWIIWDKKNPDRHFADAEMAWCSKMDNVRIIDLKRVQELNIMDNGKIHPTQKPVVLYKWILDRYAKEGDKILDTHLGSGSSRIACYDMGFDFTGYELDKEYFDKSVERFNNHIAQQQLFRDDDKQDLMEQKELF